MSAQHEVSLGALPATAFRHPGQALPQRNLAQHQAVPAAIPFARQEWEPGQGMAWQPAPERRQQVGQAYVLHAAASLAPRDSRPNRLGSQVKSLFLPLS